MMTNRRTFIRQTGSIALGAGLMSAGGFFSSTKTHLVTLSFDDGFEKSFVKTAEIYEKYGLRGCFNIVATAHHDDFKSPEEHIKKEIVGDFDLWNDLKSRGHEVMPHGYRHARLTEMPFEEARNLITKCLDYFSENLNDFRQEEAIFNFPFNGSTPEIESWLETRVRAFRTSGSVVNPLPRRGLKKLTCISKGPENIDRFFEEQIDQFLSGDGGWFIFNTHGLDGQGWGPMSSVYLDELLGRLVEMDNVEIISPGEALRNL